MRTFFLQMIFSALLLKPVSSQAQQHSFGQYSQNQSLINPAYSLLDNTGSLNALSRHQWLGMDGAPATMFLNGSMPIKSIGAAIGGALIFDRITVEKRSSLSAYLAKSVRLNQKSHLSVSLTLGAEIFRGDYSSLASDDFAFADDIRESLGFLGAGVMFYSPEHYYIGLSAPAYTFRNERLSSPVYFSSAYLQSLNQSIKIKPATLISYERGDGLVARISAMLYLKERLGFGAGFDTRATLSGSLSCFFEQRFGLTYSYQTAGKFAGVGAGATHEIGLALKIGKNIRITLL